MRELSAGVYNVLKSHSARPMSAGNIMSKLNANDQQLEANLSTMLQTVRGTKQYWFTKQGELTCMVRELAHLLSFSHLSVQNTSLMTSLPTSGQSTLSLTATTMESFALCTQFQFLGSFPTNSMHFSRRYC